MSNRVGRLAAETVEGTALTLQGVDDVHGCDGLPLGVLTVRDGITDDVLKEHLQDTTSFLVDQTADALDTTTTSQTTDRGFGDTLDVITEYLPMTLGASFAESLSSFTSA